MALTFTKLATLALQIAKNPGFTAQAGDLFNMILGDLSQTYDFDSAQGFTTFNFNTALAPPVGSPVVMGSGPYPLPADYLRANLDDVFWTLLGVPYKMIHVDQSEFDGLVQQAGLASYPYFFTTDMSTSPPGMYVYVPPSGNYQVFIRYQRQMPDTVNPETSGAIPWFPNDTYMLRRLTGELMLLAGDDRWIETLGEGPHGAQGILTRYLKLCDDKEDRSQRVHLDRRRFGTNFTTLPNSKIVGWLLLSLAFLPNLVQ